MTRTLTVLMEGYMNENLKIKADQMLERYVKIEKDFIWESNLAKHFVALIMTQADKEYSKEHLKNALEVINKNSGVFSNFRGMYRLMLAGLMVVDSDSVEGTFSKILNCENTLKEAGFKSSTHLPLASYALYKISNEESPRIIASKAKQIYQEMKAAHPWITSGDDYSMSVMLAVSGCELTRIESAYQQLNSKGFYKGNELQRLSHILALSNRSIEELVEVCVKMKDMLKQNKMNLSASFYATLGIIALIYFEDEQIMSDWIELSIYLNHQKKYKWLGKGMNIMLASALVSDRWIDETLNSEVAKLSISISIEALISAQMAAVIAATSASAAAGASAAT